MKNLFERMKLEDIQKLESFRSHYECTIDILFNSLKENNYFTGLSYGCICTLSYFLGLNDYSPTSINNLFDNE